MTAHATLRFLQSLQTPLPHSAGTCLVVELSLQDMSRTWSEHAIVLIGKSRSLQEGVWWRSTMAFSRTNSFAVCQMSISSGK